VMSDKYCRECTESEQENFKATSYSVELVQLIDDSWWCKEHASSFLEKEEKRLIYSPNRATSITEQRLLDQVRMLKSRIKIN